jgi:hypothetical protein
MAMGPGVGLKIVEVHLQRVRQRARLEAFDPREGLIDERLVGGIAGMVDDEAESFQRLDIIQAVEAREREGGLERDRLSHNALS